MNCFITTSKGMFPANFKSVTKMRSCKTSFWGKEIGVPCWKVLAWYGDIQSFAGYWVKSEELIEEFSEEKQADKFLANIGSRLNG